MLKLYNCRSNNDLLDEWLCSMNIKESSMCCYRTKIENHIRIYFTGVKYEDADETVMRDFMRELMNKHMSGKYIADIMSILSAG